ncbi:IS4 family transposase [Endozoicomonas sp. ISHI1]|uniref:IS4 family transposase n=1 Tax=Endozoicomonas sp. ISHI1 TaxID=2825882 RepID=UPI0021471DB8|nr:IS4 family transposase [Endozoicomonas sp. ISHI1]
MEPADLLIEQFRTYLNCNKCRLSVLAYLVLGLLEKQTVNFTHLATTFPGNSQTASCYRLIQGFFLEVVFEESITARMIASLFAPEGKWQLSMDRTNWLFGMFKINILFLAINYKGMAIPILWTLLSKKGCSNTTERIELLQRFQKIFPEQAIQRLLMDRESKGRRWLKFLVNGNWPFCIRVPNNTWVPNKHQNRLLPVTRIFSLTIGETMAIRQPRKVWRQMVYLAASKKGSDPMVVICNADPWCAIENYLQRWQIETMFQAMKSRGFNLEETHSKDRDKISKLLCALVHLLTSSRP